MKQTLFMMLGYPGSGKSHFAKRLAHQLGAVRINSDAMRSSVFDEPSEHYNAAGFRIVFGALDYAAHEILSVGHTVIYDANCNRRSERAKNVAIANEHNADVYVIWVQTPPEEAAHRAANRELGADQVQITQARFNEIKEILEEPTDDEKVIKIDGTVSFEEQLKQFTNQFMAGIKQVENTPLKSVIKEVKLFTDGGSRGNPGPSSSGYAIFDMDGNTIEKGGEYLGVTTNNQAEYQAVKLGLEMNSIFKIKNRDLWPIHQAIKDLKSEFEKVTFTHVPREMNKIADEQVNIILDNETGPK
jgi:ribonuclease HI